MTTAFGPRHWVIIVAAIALFPRHWATAIASLSRATASRMTRKRLDQMTPEQLVREYTRCSRAVCAFPNHAPGASQNGTRQRDYLNRRIAKIIRILYETQ